MNDADWLRKRLRRKGGGCLVLLVPLAGTLLAGSLLAGARLAGWLA